MGMGIIFRGFQNSGFVELYRGTCAGSITEITRFGVFVFTLVGFSASGIGLVSGA